MNALTTTQGDISMAKRLGWILTIGGVLYTLYIISGLASGVDLEMIKQSITEDPTRVFVGTFFETWLPLVFAVFGFPIARKSTKFLATGTPVSRLGWVLTVGGIAYSLYIFAALAWFLTGASGIDQDFYGLQEARKSFLDNPGFLIQLAFEETWSSLAIAALGFPIARILMIIADKVQAHVQEVAEKRATNHATTVKSNAGPNVDNNPVSKMGIAFVVLGAIGLVIALSQDTTVSTGYGRVYNLGLLQSQQMYLFVSGLLILIGGGLCLGAKKERSAILAPQQSPEISTYDGERNIATDGYQIFLVKKYTIEKNDTLGKFIVRDRSFESLNLALKYADDLEGNRPAD